MIADGRFAEELVVITMSNGLATGCTDTKLVFEALQFKENCFCGMLM